jgi:Homeodomain
MDYPREQFPYHVASQQDHPHQQYQQQHQLQHPQHVGHPSLPYEHCPVRPHHVEAYYPSPSHGPYVDYGSIPPDDESYENFEGCSEISTRPRLTKEQVEVLEAQFQAHPKPNSNVKRQLALQTKLTLPRVAVCMEAFHRHSAADYNVNRTGSRTDGQRPSR